MHQQLAKFLEKPTKGARDCSWLMENWSVFLRVQELSVSVSTEFMRSPSEQSLNYLFALSCIRNLPGKSARSIFWINVTLKEVTFKEASVKTANFRFPGPARLIKPMRVQNQARSGFPRFIASAINRAGSPGSCNQALSFKPFGFKNEILWQFEFWGNSRRLLWKDLLGSKTWLCSNNFHRNHPNFLKNQTVI